MLTRSAIDRRAFLIGTSSLALACASGMAGAAPSAAGDALTAGFADPPNAARPRVCWFWMDGNISTDGITLDLQWMKAIGIGGVFNFFDIALGTPKIVERPLTFLSPDWNAAFRHAVTLAESLGLEYVIAGSPGFSESGGPWIKPEEGMKKLVWSETRVRHGERVSSLPRPPSTIGPFQNVPADWSNPAMGGQAPAEPVAELYQDVAVIAYRLPPDDRSMAELRPQVSSSIGPVDGTLLWDDDLANAVTLPFGTSTRPAWLQMDFRQAQTFQAMTVALLDRNLWDSYIDPSPPVAELQISPDGVQFTSIAVALDTADAQQTICFPPATGRYFRLILHVPSDPADRLPKGIAAFFDVSRKAHRVAQWVLHAAPRVDRFEEKAGFFVDGRAPLPPTPPVRNGEAIHRRDIVDLTGSLGPDGKLDWSPPSGRWAILRTGYSLLGMTNHPATREATGLEVDKLSRKHVRAHIERSLDRFRVAAGTAMMGARGIRAMNNDSWEVGPQNWTEDLPAEFRRRRGYDIRSWLPALTGRIIESSEATDRFLWDFRCTIADLMSESHYAETAAALHAHGLRHYQESHERGRAFLGDGMDAKRHGDMPMGAIWTSGFLPEDCDADLRESASVAHIYGQNLVAAESLTAAGYAGTAFAMAPEDLKPAIDRAFTQGVNCAVIHASPHQPIHDPAPGIGMGMFGQWFTRGETWSTLAAPWISYISRSCHLLQQGRFVADILYFYGEDSNITALFAPGRFSSTPRSLPPIPDGYAYDFANAHVLTTLGVDNGRLTTKSGMAYRLLVLDPRTRLMSLPVLQRIADLVAHGAVVLGDKPEASPSLADDQGAFTALANALWGLDNEASRTFGKGRVLRAMSLDAALADIGVQPDFSCSRQDATHSLASLHRTLDDDDIYFISNRGGEITTEARFRVAGKTPELWHADSGTIEPVSHRVEGSHSVVPLRLTPNQAVFVVFRKQASAAARAPSNSAGRDLAAIEGPWTVRFQADRGAPAEANFAALHSWSADAHPGIRYFSGTARYEKDIDIERAWIDGKRHIEIDLGEVKNIAEVILNGQSFGPLWKAPFRVDITRALKPGRNRLTITVTNLWPNRLIGDKQAGAIPVAIGSFNPYQKESPLFEAGLIGPVRLKSIIA